ncbi:hypothetical protein [Novosphingobium cyanobacteriorum]|uniref:Uncharacterized protein n=1 Tax=Novosphingobium cyanobacteriorum TaxID=3024215 RepID=A0ABT6CEV1_9SPHN|nr:hypothetical protein [Novosphingobium cyanobacteriorum]MDF8331848.1 hypothetical protein [Novosphingobium cyanobacteriorum]
MDRRFVVAGAGVLLGLLVAILMVAWMMGGTQPMRWIETPVSVPPSAVAGGQQ